MTGRERELAAIRHEVPERVVELNCSYCERLLDACGDSMDIFCIGDDFATQRGLILDPVLWRRY